MDSNKSVQVRLSLYEYGMGRLPHPRDIETPLNAIKRAFIPQSVVDSIWLLFEFDSIKNRDEFIAAPGDVFVEATIVERDQEFFDKWGKYE